MASVTENLIKMLSKEKVNIQNILKVHKKLEKLLNDPKNMLQLKRDVEKLERMVKQSRLDSFMKGKIKESIETFKAQIPKVEETIREDFGFTLEKQLKELGFDLSGHYPLLKTSFYTLEVDLSNFTVTIWYGPQQERLDKCNLIAEEVVSKLKNIHKNITQRDFDDREFLLKLYEAYKISAYRNNKKLGEGIPISDVLFEYAILLQDDRFKFNPVRVNFKEYSRVFFSYDLYRLGTRKIDGKELTFVTATRAYTMKRSDFLWVPKNERGDGDYISHIKFRSMTQ